MRRFQNWLEGEEGRAALLFAALAALFWAKPLLRGQALFYDMLFRLFYPNAVFTRAALRAGVFPFWNPRLFSGVPFMANLQSALFYPFTYLCLVLDFPAFSALTTFLHTLLAALFMRRLARELGMKETGALLAGLVYGFNGFFVLHYAYTSNFSAYPWLPAALLYFRRALKEGRPSALAASALMLSFQLFAGHPQFFLYSALALGLYALWPDFDPVFERAKSGRRLALWAAALAGAGLLAAVQLLPALAFARETSRGAGLGYAWSAVYSIQPAELFIMLFGPLWNLRFNPMSGDPHIVGLYFGLPVLAFAAPAFWSEGGEEGGKALPFGLIAGSGLILAMGSHLPFYRTFYDWSGPLTRFRFPAQAAYLACFGVSVLAGLGLERVFKKRNGTRWVLAVCAADLWLFSLKAVLTIDPVFYHARTPGIEFLKAHLDEENRLFMTPRTRQENRRAGRDTLDAWMKFQDALFPNLAMAQGLNDADGNEELRFARYDEVLTALARSPASRWMDLLAVKYVVTLWDLPRPKFQPAFKASALILRNTGALPRAYFAPDSVRVRDEDFQGWLESHADHDFQKEIVLDQDGPVARPAAGAAQAALDLDLPNEVRLDVIAPSEGWLLLADAWAPGWSALVNGRPAAVLRANYCQRAVRVPAGTSVVDFLYTPPGFYTGGLLSLLAFAGLLGVLRRDPGPLS